MPNRMQTFDSNGPDLRVRGTSQQLFEKYLQLGRDATSSGDRVMAESYFQYAEHYFRILNAMNQAAAQQQANQGGHQQRRPDPVGDAMGDDGNDDDLPGFGEQPMADARDIPIANNPPDT